MKVELNFGKEGIQLELDESLDITVIRKPKMPVFDMPSEEVNSALFSPINSRSLLEEARGKKSACIVICDITRPVPNGLLLPPILTQLLDAGIQKNSITILIATGLHRPNVGQEMRELVGNDWVLDNFRVENHFARNDSDHVTLGVTTLGTDIKIDKRFVEADLKLVTGLVEPHFMAGYSGGRKVIAPGIAHKDTITRFHSSRFMSDPMVDSCILENNPLHNEQLEVAKMVGPVLSVNVVIDENRKLSFVNYGEIIDSHLRAVSFMEQFAIVRVPRKFKTVLASAAGYPLDQTYYQTVKGIVTPLGILEEGGDLIIASDCSEGLGSEEFIAAQKRMCKVGVEQFLSDVAHKRFADIDEWQTQMQTKSLKHCAVHLYTRGLSDEEKLMTGVNVIDSLGSAVEKSVIKSGDRAVAVIPEGPYVIPQYVR